MTTNLPAYGAHSFDVATDSADLDHVSDVAKPTRSGVNPELWARIWFVLAVGTLAYFVQLSEIGRMTFEGSQSAYLVVAPVLAGLVAAGYSHAPRGVIDAESDWIAATLLCIGGFAALWLIDSRLPTMAALWNLDNLGLVIWVAVCGTVVFSARHMLQMWRVWLLALVLAPATPFMLVVAELGGSDTANAAVSAALGTVAVYLALRFVTTRPRLLATAVNLAVSLGAVMALADAGLYLRVLVAAGVVPLMVVLAVYRIPGVRRTTTGPSLSWTLPRCKPQSYVVLLLAAATLLYIHLPMTRPAAVNEVGSDWITAAALDPVEDFPFISEFLGPDSSLTRYRAPGGAGEYKTVVDVMTSPNLQRLQDFSDAVWYPTPTPVNYAPYESIPDAPQGIKAAHSDADSAKDQGTSNWNAVTWIWRSGPVFQRVTVITSQTRELAVPEPQPLSLHNTLIQPALWVLRQQPLEPGVVDPVVNASTKVVVQRLISASTLPSAGDLAP